MGGWGLGGNGWSMFWVSGGGWTFFVVRWGCVEVYFGWMRVGGHFLWLVRVAGVWRHILGGWEWAFFNGWVGMGGGIFWVGGVGRGRVEVSGSSHSF